ncbi:MAG: dihydrofolate reductase [Planctomycetota bacterium]
MEHPPLSIIVAVAENGVIGVDGELPWHLSRDLQRFKRLTMGHAIIMGRKTYDSIDRLLPGRQTIVVTRNRSWELPGGIVRHDLPAAVQAAGDDPEPFVIGGASLYALALPLANRLYLTRVAAQVEGDVTFPEVDWTRWALLSTESFAADARNDFPSRLEIYARRSTP